MNKDDFLIEFIKCMEKYWRPVYFDSEITFIINKDAAIKASNALHEKIFPQKKYNIIDEHYDQEYADQYYEAMKKIDT